MISDPIKKNSKYKKNLNKLVSVKKMNELNSNSNKSILIFFPIFR